MSSLPSNQRDFIIRELPKTVAISDSELIFTSGNITSICLVNEDGIKELVINCDSHEWILDHVEAVQFISQFPREYFAKTPKLAELHLDNLPY